MVVVWALCIEAAPEYCGPTGRRDLHNGGQENSSSHVLLHFLFWLDIEKRSWDMQGYNR
jgi:hypothetical protein